MGRYDDRGGGDQLVYGTTAVGDELPLLMDTDRKLQTTAAVSGTVTVQEPLSIDDNGGSLTVDDGGGSLTVDGTVTADIRDGAGVALTSTLVGADRALDVNLVQAVNVTIQEPLSVDDSGGSLTVDNAVLSVVGGGAEATAQRVTIANDSTGILSVDDGGGSLTIDASSLPLPTSAATAANQQAAAMTAAIYNVTMTSADTEYSQALPANTRRFSLQCLTNFDVRFAFVTGKVATPTAPYALVRAGMNYFEEQLNLASATLYVASPDAAKVAEIIAWS